MKKRMLISCSMLLCVLLTACGHTHVWNNATCVLPMTCAECGETDGESLGHKWVNATCTKAKCCIVCNLEEGTSLGHDWNDATCTDAKACSKCGEKEGEPLGHVWVEATCDSPKKCTACGFEHGESLGHDVSNWQTIKYATCTEKGVQSGLCKTCGESVEKEIECVEHTPGNWEIWLEATENSAGTKVRKCKVCNRKLEEESFTLTAEEIERNYKNRCQSIPYDSLARNPGDYEGNDIKFSGRVVQVCSEASSALYYSTYRVAVSGSYNNVVYIYVDNYGSGSRILEDDWITFYGKFDGLYTYKTVMGASVTIPSVKVKYVN